MLPKRNGGLDKGLFCMELCSSYMARQAGVYRFMGTIDDLCFYKMCGDYFVRRRSSLTGKRFWKDKAFEGSRKSSKRFGEGNQLASKVYAMAGKEKSGKKLFSFLRSKAISLIKQGMDLSQAEEALIDYLVEFELIKRRSRQSNPNFILKATKHSEEPNRPKRECICAVYASNDLEPGTCQKSNDGYG